MARSSEVRLRFPPEGWRWSGWQEEVWEDSEDLDGPSVFDLCCGRGAGKDIVAMRCALRDMLKLWGQRSGGGGQGIAAGMVRNPVVKGFVIAPQENNLKQVWDDWGGMLRELARAWKLSWADTDDPEEHGWFFRHVVRERKFIILGRGEIEIEARLSGTRDSLRGPGVDVVHWSEFAVETTAGELERAYDGELAGTLSRAGRHGRVYRTTTPKGPFGGYYAKLEGEFGAEVFAVANGKLRSRDGERVFYHRDSFANEFLTDRQRARIEAERALGWYFDQERLARFVIGDKGGERVWGRELVYGCVVESRKSKVESTEMGIDARIAHRLPRVPAGRLRRVAIGVDIARYGDDWTCYCAVDEDSGEVLLVQRKSQLSGQAVVKDLERLATRFPGCVFRVDATGHKGYIADFLPTELQARVVETEFSRRKEKWVLGLSLLFERRLLRIPDPEASAGMEERQREDVRVLLRELLAFVRVIKQTTAGARIEYTHPPGEHDDTVDALILATMELAERLPGPMDVVGTVGKLQRLGI